MQRPVVYLQAYCKHIDSQCYSLENRSGEDQYIIIEKVKAGFSYSVFVSSICYLKQQQTCFQAKKFPRFISPDLPIFSRYY